MRPREALQLMLNTPELERPPEVWHWWVDRLLEHEGVLEGNVARAVALEDQGDPRRGETTLRVPGRG